jgi:hypothetical protein
VQPSRLAKDLAQTPDPKVRGTPVRMVGLHATEAAEATLLPFFARAAGVSPPWLGEPNIVQRESNIVRRLANTRSGAAGVSPPWFRFALATAIVFCGLITFRTAHSLPAPRLAYASRSRCTTFVHRTKRHLRCTNARSQERRASARRGSVNRTPCRENRTLSSGWRTHNQERRASARRGSDSRLQR